MKSIEKWDKITISIRSRRKAQEILKENPVLEKIIRNAKHIDDLTPAIKKWMLTLLKRNPQAEKLYFSNEAIDPAQLSNPDMAAIRILDYIEHAGEEFIDQNIGGKPAITHPFKILWMAANFGTGGGSYSFFVDMQNLFRQLNGTLNAKISSKDEIERWMEKYPSGLNERVEKMRKSNQKRIMRILIREIEKGRIKSKHYSFQPGLTKEDKESEMMEWWKESRFHLKFAVRSPELLNEMLDYTLSTKIMKILRKAKKIGIPFFVNPYYLSLLNVHIPDELVGADMAIRCYVIYSKQLVEEFGDIIAWEKEDKVEPGKPNVAGWILPAHNIHRRYPEVAIFIPDTVGRACGGLCASCQRMYDFQSGRYNFDLEKLKPRESWKQRLPNLLDYFKNDAQLRDILITGGDALMSSNKSLKNILDAVYDMAKNKKEENKLRAENDKYAEMVRIRIGTRLPVYLPQRIDKNLAKVLSDFKQKAQKIGIKQFVVQTHFESPMEVTSESKKAIEILLKAGWTVTNQLVFTAAASRRGHTSQLRKVLNEVGVFSYYTLTVKGFNENKANFSPNSRIVQEEMEEKIFGMIPETENDSVKNLLCDAGNAKSNISGLLQKTELPFLSTDRSIINLPGVGKSLTYRTIGITRYGRRILEFDHDPNRVHSPIINKMGKVIIIEVKSIEEYLNELEEMGEKREDYMGVFTYSIGKTQPRISMYEYPDFDYKVTDKFTNLEI